MCKRDVSVFDGQTIYVRSPVIENKYVATRFWRDTIYFFKKWGKVKNDKTEIAWSDDENDQIIEMIIMRLITNFYKDGN